MANRLPPTDAELAREAMSMLGQGKLKPAERLLKDVLRRTPDQFDAHLALGVMNGMRGDDALAVKHLKRAVQKKPASPDAQYNLGQALIRLGRTADAADALEAAAAAADLPHIHEKLGDCRRQLGSLEEAATHFYRAVELDPKNSLALSSAVEMARKLCDWSRLDALQTRLVQLATAGQLAEPLLMMHVTDDPALLRRTTAAYWQAMVQPAVPPEAATATRSRAPRNRLRVGYLSADFRQHPMVSVIAEMIERHDRQRIEAIGYSYGDDDGSPQRRRMEKAFERFADVRQHSDEALIKRLRADELDILVDLAGYTANARFRVIGARPAPVVCHYMGYPGTLASPAYDYLIADPVVVPDETLPHYREAIVRLPESYWALDTRRTTDAGGKTRRDHGLPEDAVVLCSFNGQQKLTPDMLDTWARILAAAPRSVLCLYSDTPAAARNLLRAAEDRAIPSSRLVIAGRVPPQEHLARIPLADLMLDTFPYGGHTTAADALFMGVPLLTITGRSFASRVGASLLRASALDDLVTPGMDAYERQAIALANSPERLSALRQRLADNRSTAPLFDTARFTRHMEAAFVEMAARRAAGARPSHFDVSPVANASSN